MPVIEGVDVTARPDLVSLVYGDFFLLDEIFPFYLHSFKTMLKGVTDKRTLDFKCYFDIEGQTKKYIIDTSIRFYKNKDDLEVIIENNLFKDKGYKRLSRDVVYYKIENAFLYKNKKYKEKIVEKIEALQEKFKPKLLPTEKINEESLIALNKESAKLLAQYSLQFIRLEVLYGKWWLAIIFAMIFWQSFSYKEKASSIFVNFKPTFK